MENRFFGKSFPFDQNFTWLTRKSFYIVILPSNLFCSCKRNTLSLLKHMTKRSEREIVCSERERETDLNAERRSDLRSTTATPIRHAIHHCEVNADPPLRSRRAHLTVDPVSFSSTFDRFDLWSTHPHRRCTVTEPQLRSTCTSDPMCILYIYIYIYLYKYLYIYISSEINKYKYLYIYLYNYLYNYLLFLIIHFLFKLCSWMFKGIDV